MENAHLKHKFTMKDVGSKREVLCKKAQRTKKGETRDVLTASDKKHATIAKRSESAQNSPWRNHVVAYSKKRKISYANALTDPDCKKGYVKVVKPSKSLS